MANKVFRLKGNVKTLISNVARGYTTSYEVIENPNDDTSVFNTYDELYNWAVEVTESKNVILVKDY